MRKSPWTIPVEASSGVPFTQLPSEPCTVTTYRFGSRCVLRRHDVPLTRPALELTGSVGIRTTEALQPHRDVVDGVQARQHPEEPRRHGLERSVVEVVQVGAVLNAASVNKLRHRERAAQEGLVLAQHHRWWPRHAGAGQGPGHAELARYVVRRRGSARTGGHPEHPPGTRRR